MYSAGLCAASVCAPVDMPLDEVVAEVNRQHPTGIFSAWAKSDEPFASGEPNPTPCTDPARHHYLMEC